MTDRDGAPLRARPWAWAAAVAWMLVIFWASSRSEMPGGLRLPSVPLADKVVHAFIFGVLGALLTLGSGRPRLALILTALYGATDELHQLTVGGRDADPLDWVADVIGGAAGAWLALTWGRRAARGSGREAERRGR